MPVDELREQLAEKTKLQIVDVRRPAEYESGHIPTAINLELSHLQKCLSQLDPNRATAVLCAEGYDS
jgi:rhodanese-related sulfurtransferase